jgi:hypothetical protein
MKGIQNCSYEGQPAIPRGDVGERVKTLKFSKIFSRTSWPIPIKLCRNYPWVKGILNC